MGDKAKRVFLSLNVGEVSLVDEGANNKEYIVAKRKEHEMDTETDTESTETETDTKKSVETESDDTEMVETETDGSDDVLKNVHAAVAKLQGVLKAGYKPKMEKDGAGAKKAGGGGKGGKMPPFLKKMEEKLKKQGMAADAIKSALSAALSVMGDSEDTQKAKEPAPFDAEQFKDEVMMEALSSVQAAVSKAKAFTPKRQGELVGIVQKLVGLLEDLGVSKESFGASGISTTGTTETPKPPMAHNHGTSGTGEPSNTIAKSKGGGEDIGAAITKALSPLLDSVKGLAERVESIEKARNPSTSVEDEGGGSDKTVKKNKSMWSGVL